MIQTEEEYKQKTAELELLLTSISMAGGFDSAPAHLLSALDVVSDDIERWETEHYPIPTDPSNEEGEYL
jgi:hypothetical protein